MKNHLSEDQTSAPTRELPLRNQLEEYIFIPNYLQYLTIHTCQHGYSGSSPSSSIY